MNIITTLPETTSTFVTLMQDENGVFGYTTRSIDDKLQVQMNDLWVDADFSEATPLGYVIQSDTKEEVKTDA